jgi:hypothetical protein
MGKQDARPISRILLICLIGCLALQWMLSLPDIVLANNDPPVDWRGNLTCPSQHQVHEGILYCRGEYEGGSPVHVLVVDLTASDLRFEYILPEGASDGHDGVQECRDPNVPAWGGLPAKGCFTPDNRGQYPRMPISDAVERAREVRDSPGLSALINADYTDTDNGSHGPEGLLVVRGERLDGAVHCDDDYNAALRPWLGLGEAVDPTTGLLPATIARLPTDGSPVPSWIYTGIGGGPWLVQNDTLDEGAAVCKSGYSLEEIDPVENCYKNDKRTPNPPAPETYLGGSCRAAPHTAAGISVDGRWLFLAVSTGDDRPKVLARFLRNQLGAANVMKFDGGGSSQLWFAGDSNVTVDPSGQKRRLNSFLAVYSSPGEGIALPLAAEPMERVYFQVLSPDERLDLTVRVRNTGNYTWSLDDDIVLRHDPFFLLSPLAESLPLPGPIAPGEVATWHLDLGLSGALYRRYQLYYMGEPLGSDMAVIAVALPEGMEKKRQELEDDIQKIIDEWKAKGETELDELVKDLQQHIEAILAGLVTEAVEGVKRTLEETARETCGSSAMALVLSAVAFAWRRR